MELEGIGDIQPVWGSPERDTEIDQIQFADNIRLETTPNSKNDGVEPCVSTPEVGMEYETWEQIDLHFRCYAKQNGFAVTRVGAGVRQKDGMLTKIYRNVTWRCEQWGEHTRPPKTRSATLKSLASSEPVVGDDEGQSVEPPLEPLVRSRTTAGYSGVSVGETKSKKCNCPVTIYASATKEGVWSIKKAILKHENHEPSPSRVQYISAYRQKEWTPAIRRRLFNDLEAGINIPQIHRGLARERNGIENFPLTQRDLRNAVTKDRREKLQGGDAKAMFKYLKRMKADNENFYYKFRLDEFKRLRDIMWVDARSRAAYEDFGDVVCFDSTYITNEYELPFANFVGVNHHGHTLLLGCALLSKEDSDTFDWLFRCWLDCMGGKSPVGFLTDQDATIRKSVANVLPDVRHRWCLWHILQKFSKKLGAYEKYEEIKEALHNVIYDSLTPEEFTQRWEATAKEFSLEENSWLQVLFEEREMWIPTYMKHLFWAGMKTTQRSESINSFFDGFVNKKTKLYQFVQQYVNALEHRASVEKAADADCLRYTQRCVTTFPLERTYSKLYTHNKFSEVQVQCSKVLYVRLVKTEVLSDEEVDITLMDRVWVLHKPSRREIATEGRRMYKVKYNTVTNEATCVCKMFEAHGILCSHVIAVYDTYQVKEIPEKYILPRWRKDIKRKHTKVKVAYYDPTKTEEVKRMDKMNVMFDTLCLQASTADEDVAFVLQKIREAHSMNMERRAKAKESVVADNSPQTQVSGGNDTCGDGGSEQQLALDPDGLQTPGEHGSTVSLSADEDVRDPPRKKKVGRGKEKRYLSCTEKPQTKSRRKKKGKALEKEPSTPQQSQSSQGSIDTLQPCCQYPPLSNNAYPLQPPLLYPNEECCHGGGCEQSPNMHFRPPCVRSSAQGYGPCRTYCGHQHPSHAQQIPCPEQPPVPSDLVFIHGVGYVPRAHGPYGPVPDWFYRDCLPHLSPQQQSNFISSSLPSTPSAPSVGNAPTSV